MEIRKLLKVKPKDKVAFAVEGQTVKLTPIGSRLAVSYKAVPALNPPLSLKEMSDIAREEHAQEAVREGL